VSRLDAPEVPRLPPVRRVRWPRAFRIIPTRYPPVALFERIGDPAAWEVLAEIEALTNPRIRDEVGDIACVPVGERVSGPGAAWVMGPFAHRRASRFTDGAFGVYYCSDRQSTAIAETRWHMARFYAATAEAALDVEMRVLVGTVDDRFHDLRAPGLWRDVLSPDDYSAAQALGRDLFACRSRGVVYPSVRDAAGRCVAAFTPRAVGRPRVSTVLRYHWNGACIDRVFDYATERWSD